MRLRLPSVAQLSIPIETSRPLRPMTATGRPAATTCRLVTTLDTTGGIALIAPGHLGDTERNRPPTAPQNSTQHLSQNQSRSQPAGLSGARRLRDVPRGLQLRFARPHSAPSRPTPAPGAGRVRTPLLALCQRMAKHCAGLSRALLFPAGGQANPASPSAGTRPVPAPIGVDFSPPGPPLGGAVRAIPFLIAPPAPPHGGVPQPAALTPVPGP